jgi:hypothetical protein
MDFAWAIKFGDACPIEVTNIGLKKPISINSIIDVRTSPLKTRNLLSDGNSLWSTNGTFGIEFFPSIEFE